MDLNKNRWINPFNPQKGYITIEVVDEQTGEKQNKDGKEGNKEDTPDYSI
jgi:hypothetical protein